MAEDKSHSWLESREPLSDAEKAILNSRLTAYAQAPDEGSSWEEVEMRLLARLQSNRSPSRTPSRH